MHLKQWIRPNNPTKSQVIDKQLIDNYDGAQVLEHFEAETTYIVAHDIFKRIFLSEIVWIVIKISLKFCS